SVDAAAQIHKSGVIKAQDPHGGSTDMPTGVYTTRVDPSNSTSAIVHNNYDDGERVAQNYEKLAEKTEVAFKFPRENIPQAQHRTETKRDEWITHRDLLLKDSSKVIVRDPSAASELADKLKK